MASIPSLFAAGTGPSDAIAPSDQRVSLAGKMSQWYVFRDEGDNTPISVQMQADNGVYFAVYTPDNLRQPIGRGTPNSALHNDLFWTGNFNKSGNYYVLVSNSNSNSSGLRLAITGPKVSFPTAGDTSATSTALPLVTSSKATLTDGTLAIDGNVRNLNKGDSHVYTFNYNGKGGQILINLVDLPFGTATFEVWTPAEWSAHSRPVGVGSPNKYVGRDSLVWSGNFNSAGTYHIVIRHTGAAQAASYTLNVSGSGVSY